MELKINQIEDFIKTLDETNLVYFNRLIVARLNLMHQAKSTCQMSHFNVGDEVYFINCYGNRIEGKIFKLNKKTVSILTKDMAQWNVSPSLLKRQIN